MIVKDDVGKSKPTTRRLPAMNFTYGRPDQTNQEGAGAVCTSWKFHIETEDTGDNNPRNFKKLNKKAVIDGMVTAHQNWEYRKNHDARIPFGKSALKQN